MKKILCTVMVIIILLISAIAFAGALEGKYFGVIIPERTKYLDEAYSTLNSGNMLLVEYNKRWNTSIDGGGKWDKSKLVQCGIPKFFVEEIDPKVLSYGMDAGDYLINTETGDLMICIGWLVNTYVSENLPSLVSSEGYPLILSNESGRAIVSIVGADQDFTNGEIIPSLKIDDWTVWRWFRM